MINEPHRHFSSYSVTTTFYEGPIWDPCDNVVKELPINNSLNFLVKRSSFCEKNNNKYLVYKHFLSPEQFFKYVKIMMTYKDPWWVPHGLKFLYGTRMGQIWASCPDSAHMGPICPCVLGAYLANTHLNHIELWKNYRINRRKRSFKQMCTGPSYSETILICASFVTYDYNSKYSIPQPLSRTFFYFAQFYCHKLYYPNPFVHNIIP